MTEDLNVVVASVECARADHLSCYGYARETTPFLDQVARQGVRFSHMFATAPWSLPSQASLATGMFPATHGATAENSFLSPRYTTLAEHLKAAGYRTAAFCTNPWISPETGFGRGFDAFFTQRYHNRVAARAISFGRRASDRLLRRGDAGARRTNHALRRWIAADTRPFFAFVHYNEAHLPLHPPPPYDRALLPSAVTPARVREVNQDSGKYLARQVEMNEEDFGILRALYDGELRYVDMRLREIAEGLESVGLWERTLLVVTGSHGIHLGDHQIMGDKLTLYDALIRVPLLLRCPERVPQGYVIDELAQTIDVMPTVLRLLGVSAEGVQIHGRPLIEQGHATPGPEFVIAERYRPRLTRFRQRFPSADMRPYEVRQKAIRTRREKFIWQSDEANELYDVVADPGEERNLIEARPQAAETLRRQLFDWLASVDKFEAPDESASEQRNGTREARHALGDAD